MGFADLTGAVFDAVLAVHGEAVEYRPKSGATPYAITGAYSATSIQIDQATGTAVRADVPILEVRESAVTGGGPKQGDKVYLTARAVLYRVVKIDKDGGGNVLLSLQKASDPP